MPPSIDLLQGTLDLLILKTLAHEPMHGWGIVQRIQQISNDVLQIRRGSLYLSVVSRIGVPTGTEFAQARHRLSGRAWHRSDAGRAELPHRWRPSWRTEARPTRQPFR
jgi:hypothetical protein